MAFAQNNNLTASLPTCMLRVSTEDFDGQMRRIAENQSRVEQIKAACKDYILLRECGKLKFWLDTVLLATSQQRAVFREHRIDAETDSELQAEEDALLAARRTKQMKQMAEIVMKEMTRQKKMRSPAKTPQKKNTWARKLVAQKRNSGA